MSGLELFESVVENGTVRKFTESPFNVPPVAESDILKRALSCHDGLGADRAFAVQAVVEHEGESSDLLLFLVVCLIIGVALRVLFNHFRVPVPYSVGLLIAGILLGLFELDKSESVFVRSMTMLTKANPESLLYTFLPALLFDSAFGVHFHLFWRAFWPGMLMVRAFGFALRHFTRFTDHRACACVQAGPAVIINMVCIAIVAMLFFGYGWNWSTALMFGASLGMQNAVELIR